MAVPPLLVIAVPPPDDVSKLRIPLLMTISNNASPGADLQRTCTDRCPAGVSICRGRNEYIDKGQNMPVFAAVVKTAQRQEKMDDIGIGAGQDSCPICNC
jgi:hypothetical protein